jgi:hypothetical protein
MEWLWHMPGVTLGALLLLALALSEVEARATFWPRLGSPVGEPAAAPPGTAMSDPASPVFRWAGAALCLVLLVGLAFPYLSFRYRVAALGYIPGDPTYAVELAGTAAWLRPYDPDPLLVEAEAHREEARAALANSARLVARREATVHLAEALSASLEAAEREPVNWVVHYEAALTALDLVAAREPAWAVGARAEQWGRLLNTGPLSSNGFAPALKPLPPPPDSDQTTVEAGGNSAAGVLAPGDPADLEPAEILDLAGRELRRAEARNPLSTEVAGLLEQWRERQP